MLSSIVVTTSVSFVVNAYNYLFIKRYAIYIFFAVVPLLWTIIPLIGGAIVTSSFHNLKYVVIKSWVEIPEKYDKNWSRVEKVKRAKSKAKHNKERRKSKILDEYGQVINKVKALVNKAKARFSLSDIYKIAEHYDAVHGKSDFKDNQDNISDDQSVDTKVNQKGRLPVSKFVRKTIRRRNQGSDKKRKPTNVSEVKTHENVSLELEDEEGNLAVITSDMTEKHLHKEKDLEIGMEVKPTDIIREKRETATIHIEKSTEEIEEENEVTEQDEHLQTIDSSSENEKEESLSKIEHEGLQTLEECELNSEEVLFTIDEGNEIEKQKSPKCMGAPGRKHFKSIVDVVKTAKVFKKSKKYKAFNYEKYTKFLELTLGHIGFSIGKVLITWDRVSFFIVILSTLVGVFAQNALLK